MRAVVYAGPETIRVDDVRPPQVRDPADAIVAVTSTAICASDLHLVAGKTPGMRVGAVIGHEFVGTVAAAGRDAGVAEGDRVLGSFLIACGRCRSCSARRFNLCERRRALGLGTLVGDLDGAQAERVRVPDARLNLKVLAGEIARLPDDAIVLGGDVMTTGLYSASVGEVGPGDVVVVVGAGPVGLFCALAARHAGADAVFVLDRDPRRQAFAERVGIPALRVDDDDAADVVARATHGRMADVVVEAVGAVAALRSAVRCARDGGRVVVVGVYGAERYDLPLGRVWVRALDLRFAGLGNIHAHWDRALALVAAGELDPAAVITHRLPLEEAETGYRLFAARAAMKVVLAP